MNGADMLCDVLLVNQVDVCFSNPGTSEMHFVAALDRKPEMRCVLGLSETVVTGAADGYARMARKTAATLLHCGPGLANGLANLHNARRARTPIFNVVGDHAAHHLQYDAPLTTDIESLARPMSNWVGRAAGSEDVRRKTEEGLAAAYSTRGPATLILPADAAWNEVAAVPPKATPVPPDEDIDEGAVRAAAKALRAARNPVLLLSGEAVLEAAQLTAARIAAATNCTLLSQSSARYQYGEGRVRIRQLPYPVDAALKVLEAFDVAICVGSTQPVSFFAYPGKPSTLLPSGCLVLQLARHEHDLGLALEMLAAELGIGTAAIIETNRLAQGEIGDPSSDELTPDAISQLVARRLPENAILIDEAMTSIARTHEFSPMLPRHDTLPITGGAIGIGVPLATGAAIGAPGRQVIALQADGSAMYSIQGLWTQARERLKVLTIIYANNAYRILQGEMTNVGVNSYGRNAARMLELTSPTIDWCGLAGSLGVEAGAASSATEFRKLLEAGLAADGPFLIQANV